MQWLAHIALVAYLTQGLIARTELPTCATLATHDSHSLKKMMTASCTFIISAESCHIATWLCGAREFSMISRIVKPLSSVRPRTVTHDILGVTDVALTCASEPVAYLTQGLIGRTELPMYDTLALHDGHSLKKMRTASCTLIISAEQHERLLDINITSHRNMFMMISRKNGVNLGINMGQNTLKRTQ